VSRRRLALILGVLVVAIIALLWVPPALAGPTVDCGQLDQATCDEVWPDVVAKVMDRDYGPPVPMPVTRVVLSGGESCLSFDVWWLLWYGVSVNVLC
jgi:hypothetical protein